MRKRIRCECGAEFAVNTWSQHVSSIKKCTLSKHRKEFILMILSLKSQNRSAWRISQGIEAIADSNWFYSVIYGDTLLSDWSFDSPRIVGAITPLSRKKMSRLRTGSSNPAIRNIIPNYSITELSDLTKQSFHIIEKCNKQNLRDIMKIIESNYPRFKLMFSDRKYITRDKKRGYNKDNFILADLLNIDIDELLVLSKKFRGRAISKGQKASSKFLLFASRQGASLSSKWRISKPQKILFEMIKSVDSLACIEKSVNYKGKYKVFDIFSPKINAVIEMHGRVFHDPYRTKDSLTKIAIKNNQNDLLKESIANSLGMKYLVFWDDEIENWFLEITKIYGVEPIPYENAKNKVDGISREDAGL